MVNRLNQKQINKRVVASLSLPLFRVSCAAEREAHSDCWLNLVIPSGRVSAFSRDEILSLGGCQGIAIPRKHHSPPRLTYPIRLRLCRVLSSRHHVGDCALLIRA
ncbi:hypothetical protein F2Q68_00020024 [Brassica cretica]|uniref:Uncharacterized protein n=2 Tax=Brassica cretica TaxID=69181 RepID=A0A3N6S4E7_BRACR|nr:hypothetical protein F2Q68_00020024 [Brassica cretica]KAF3565543.1 hypothetical protein DY000_02013276 [Brassica cretica]